MEIEEKIGLIDNYEEDKNILLKKIKNIFNFKSLNFTIDIGNNVFDDLNIYHDSNHNMDESIFNIINHTHSLYGEYTLQHLIKNPIYDIDTLTDRQNNIKRLLKDDLSFKNIEVRLRQIKFNENKTLWFWDDVTDEIKSIYDMIYFNIPIIDNYLNKNELILNLLNLYKIFGAPIFNVLLPVLTFIIPYIVFLFYNKNISITTFFKFMYNSFIMTSRLLNRFNFGNKTKFFTIFIIALYVFLYIQSGYYTIKQSIDTNRIINTLHKKICFINNDIKNIVEVWKIVKECGLTINYDIDDEIEYFENLFSGLNDKVCWFSNKGKILSVYQKFIDSKDRYINLLKYIGEVDVYMSLTKLYYNFKSTDNKYSFAKYLDNKEKPYLSVNKVWHPILVNKPKMNSIRIGKKDKNLLITGPNKAGKSIFIKSLATSLLFAQTIGIVPARKCHLTPFKIVNSYLHIPDSTGHSSLFEAEMYRARDYIEKLKKIKGNFFSFIIMDEIFTSTNFVEGYSSAYAISKKMSQFENSISIITTHYTGLNKLEKETDKKITNYKFSIDRDENNEIIYNYKLEKGYSQQYIALDLLKDNKFDPDIIEDAIKISNEIQKNNYV